MIFSFNIRFLAYARRGVRAIEDIRDSLSTIARCAEDEWKVKHAPRKPSKMAFSTMDVTAIDARRKLEAELRGEPPKDDDR